MVDVDFFLSMEWKSEVLGVLLAVCFYAPPDFFMVTLRNALFVLSHSIRFVDTTAANFIVSSPI